MFFFTVQVDQENRMTIFFWRDDRSRVDYDCFGDVVVFDTTYRTNKYNLICALFVGVDHHWQNVMFGCAFLLGETTDSFIWLFKSFLESMGNRSPITIFTNQDQAMSNAYWGSISKYTSSTMFVAYFEKCSFSFGGVKY